MYPNIMNDLRKIDSVEELKKLGFTLENARLAPSYHAHNYNSTFIFTRNEQTTIQEKPTKQAVFISDYRNDRTINDFCIESSFLEAAGNHKEASAYTLTVKEIKAFLSFIDDIKDIIDKSILFENILGGDD